jgi:serine protease AprX
MKYLVRTLGSALGIAALAPTMAFAAPILHHPKISRDAAALPSSQTVPVIIQYAADPDQSKMATIVALGGSVVQAFHTIHALVANVPVVVLQELANDPDITYISLDRGVGARQAAVTAAEYTTEPINAPQVWAKGYDGTGIGVAVIDSGINAVDDLSNKPWTLGPFTLPGFGTRVVYSQSFVQGDASTADKYGHGTHVAGLIAGNGLDSTGPLFYRTFSGSAPNANLINLRVLDKNGAGSDASVIQGIERAIALQKVYNIRVINLSLGRPIYESYKLDPLCQAVEQAWKAGIVVVAAAGNDGRDLALNPEGYGTIEAPGNDPYVLTVGAMRSMETPEIKDDLIASYSSKGPSFIDHVVKPDIVAPGNLVTSLKFQNDPLAVDNPTFETPYADYVKNGPNQPSASYFPLSGHRRYQRRGCAAAAGAAERDSR